MIPRITLAASLLGCGLLPAAIIPVTDANVLNGLSPYNWVCRTDSISSTINGASIRLKVKGTRRLTVEVATGHLAAPVPASFPILGWTVNGGPLQTYQLKANDTSVLLSSTVADPEIDLYIKGMSPIEDRFSGDLPANSVKITGFGAQDGASTLTLAFPEKIWLNIGDSIMSGDGAAFTENQGRPADQAWAASEDGRASYGYLLARHYGYREARIAHGGYNWAGGMANVPALSTLIDQRTSTVTRLQGDKLSPLPHVVLVNLGENGAPADADVIQSLTKLRSRVSPGTRIIVMIPVSGLARAEVTRAFKSYKESAKDEFIYLLDCGKLKYAVCDGQHPTAAGHQSIFKAALTATNAIVSNETKAPVKPAPGLPFWRIKRMVNEPVLFIQKPNAPVASAKLLFTPRGKPVLTHPDQVFTYVEGRDYVWKPNSQTIELTATSRIPFKKAADMTPAPGSPNLLNGVLWAEGHYFHDLQVQVSYDHAGGWPAPKPTQAKRLTRSLAKLKAKQPVNIVALGDSITEGYNASGFRLVSVPPYQPPYPRLVADTLQARFGAPVTLTNLGLGGTRANWGLEQVARVAAEKPDVVLLAFGMNHQEAAKEFKALMTQLRDAVRSACPTADIVLVASMTGNPLAMPDALFSSYRDALRELETTDVVLADVTTLWQDLLKRKTFADLTGNGINHPNDFGHRIYAQVICELFASAP
jgi:lysophospholipase L1-like esterase